MHASTSICLHHVSLDSGCLTDGKGDDKSSQGCIMDKRQKKPSGAQFRKRRKEEEEKRAKDKGMQVSMSDVNCACNETVAYTLFISLLLICCYLATEDDCIWFLVLMQLLN